MLNRIVVIELDPQEHDSTNVFHSKLRHAMLGELVSSRDTFQFFIVTRLYK